MSAKKPDLFVVGAPKSGTTSMGTYLSQHPQVFVEGIGRAEPHLFGTDLRFTTRPCPDAEAYLALFEKADDEKVLADKSTWYLYSERAAEEIHQFAPEAKIVIMLRNPVDFMRSLHGHNLYHGYETIESFEAALSAEGSRRAGYDVPPDVLLPDFLYYREAARFVDQVPRYFDAFGRDNVFVILLDDLVADPSRVYLDTLEFIGVDDCVPWPSFEAENSGKRARSRLLWKVHDGASPGWQRLVRGLLPASVRKKAAAAVARINVDRTRSPLEGRLRMSLTEEFAPEVEALGGLLQRDLSHWTAR